jgi:solute:Na+ symporter, SSS family
MLAGGGTTLLLTITGVPLPFGLDPNIFGISASAVVFISWSGISSTGKLAG